MSSPTIQRELEWVMMNLLIKGDSLQQVVPARLLPHQKVLLFRTLQLILTTLPATTAGYRRACSPTTIHVTHCWSFKVNTVEYLICCIVSTYE